MKSRDGVLLEGFRDEGQISAKGQPEGLPPLPRRPGGTATPWPRRGGAWPGGGPLGASFGHLESSVEDIFLDFSEHFFFTLCCNAQHKLALGTELVG